MRKTYFDNKWKQIVLPIVGISLGLAVASQAQTLPARTAEATQMAAALPPGAAAVPDSANTDAQSNEQAATLKKANLAVPSQPTGWFNDKFATGNWGGLRVKLFDKGIDPFVYWTGIGSGNPVGGVKQGHVTAVDDFYMGVNLDLGKIAGWRGASITISGVNRDGTGLTNAYIHSQYNVQQSVGGQSLFFYQLFLKQKLDDGKVTVKAGRFGASDDINASPLYGYYVNNGIDGDIRNVLFDTQFSAYPFATWAGLVRFDPNKNFNVQTAVYQTWDNIFDSSLNGVDWTIHPDDGVILMEQVAWTPTFVSKSAPTATGSESNAGTGTSSRELPGHYWVGTTYSPWKGFAQFTSPEKVGNSYGFWVHADQMVYQKHPGTTQGLTVWTASGYYPQENIAIVPFQWSGGLIDQGLFDKRPNDRTILGFIYGKFSRDYAHTIVAQGKGNPEFELVLEAAQRFQVSKSVFFQPDVQWIDRPSGTGRIPNAVVAGAEMGVTF
jgi:porin